MSIKDKNKIDAIADNPGDDSIRLLMMEEREWVFVPERLEQLEDKVSSYYNFVATGQLNRTLPASQGRKRFVELHCQYEPSEPFMVMFAQIAELFSRQSIGFRVILVRSMEETGAVTETLLFP